MTARVNNKLDNFTLTLNTNIIGLSLSIINILLAKFLIYYSSIVFNSFTYSISSNFCTCIFTWCCSSSSSPSSFCFSYKILHEEQLDFPSPTWKTVKGFPNRPIGIPCDVRSTPNDVIWTEIWGDGIRFNTNSNYCDDGDLVNGDGCQGWCSYSIYIYWSWYWI